ncbi:MAG: tRNA (adenosine(37)-N6)-threonylcarbamoyltransferase complex ATPase subunit type 1 TsaE [Rickettsiales bacterium]|jgi:tRNA threonylcarbamoyladenosine biosynthesis protein TsaE|nr:tRNA (adenosine(37)-N6)-threonylcarbamoyltransferase complex ATPase subunit type 1 TsaE [Rickettsiales bacterium]
MIKFVLKSEEDTRNLAIEIAKSVKRTDVVALEGDLGSGKTFFASAFVNYFYGIESRGYVNVISPTFNIVKVYETNNFSIHHFDLYRIKKVEELYELDLSDAFWNVSLIEWPDIARNLLPTHTIDVKIKLIGEYREVNVKNWR